MQSLVSPSATQSPARGSWSSSLQVVARRRLSALLLPVALLAACNEASPPPQLEVLRLQGTPYQRGLQHGKQLSSKIKSFYTTMLKTSLLPYLNREQTDIAAVLKGYDPLLHPEYGNGQFSTLLLRESAAELEKDIPQVYRDEMRGVADGAGVPYEDVLVLNTFVDSVLAARSVTYFLRQAGAPIVGRLEALSPTVESDGKDNDGDGKTDEAKEGQVDYAASPTATFVEVPVDTKFRFRLTDANNVRAESVRILVGDKVYTAGDPSLQMEPLILGSGATSEEDLVVTWTPPEPLPAASVVTIGIQAGDGKLLTVPPPSRYRTMRTEQFTITTVGTGKTRWEVRNLGQQDATTQPPSVAFAVRGTATITGDPLIGAHFALLDAGTSHKHCVVQIHNPDSGPSFAFVGWAGIIYGFSGVSSRGVAYAANMSDTLSNPLVKQVKDFLLNAKLLSAGEPVGFVGRRILENAKDATEAAEMVRVAKHSFGWNFLLADKNGQIRAAEVYSVVLPDEQLPSVTYGPSPAEPGAADPYGRSWSSVRGDDLRQSVSYRALANDLDANILYDLKPQRFWSSYYYTSIRAFGRLGDLIDRDYGKFDVDLAIATLRDPKLVDRNDSMQATVIEPKQKRIRIAAGEVPATDGEFRLFELPTPTNDPASAGGGQ